MPFYSPMPLWLTLGLVAMGAFAWLVPLTAHGQTLSPAADTFIHFKSIGEVGAAEGANPRLGIKSDHPRGGNDRLIVLRYDIPADPNVSGATLRLAVASGNKSSDTKHLELYAVADGANELSFAEATWVAEGNQNAVDKSGNRLKEQFVVDPLPDSKAVEPTATATLQPGATTVAFSSGHLDEYLRSRASKSAAFIIAAAPPEAKGSTPSAFVQSKEASGGASAPSLTLSGAAPAPSAEAAPPPGSSAEPPRTDPKNGAIIGTRIDFEPRDGVELFVNQVRGEPASKVVYHFYNQDGRQFNLPAMGDADAPFITDEQARSGSHSIKFHAGPSPPSNTDRDRIEFRFKQGATDEEPFRFGQDRWYGVSLYIDPASEVPAKGEWLHVGQLWQPHRVGKAAAENEWGIPLAMSVLPGREGFDLAVVTKSDGRRSEFELGRLEKGVWHDLTFNVLLSHSRDDIDGHLRIWIDGKPVVDEIVDIGNYPRDPQEDGFFAGDGIDIRFGLYRRNQPLTHTFFLDDLWFDDKPRDPSLAGADKSL